MRYLLITLLLLTTWAKTFAQAPAGELPPRPNPFRFVTDQAGVLKESEVKTLDGGLRRYADQTGTQIVVVTVPSLGGRPVADYARALGTAWGVGQRDKNNGLVLLVSPTERQVSIQAGRGLQSQVTPAVVQRVIKQRLGPSFKQGNYYAGLRAGLNDLMLAANPASDPRRPGAAGSAATGAAAPDATAADGTAAAPLDAPAATAPSPTETAPAYAPPTPAGATETGAAADAGRGSSGPGLGTIALLVLGGGGLLLLLRRLFRSRSAAPAGAPGGYPGGQPGNPPSSSAPDFTGRGNGPQRPGPQPGGYGPGYGAQPQGQGGGLLGGSGPGIGGILATGAAAAAGAYLGNRMAGGSHADNLSDGSGHALGGQQAGFGGGGLAGGGSANDAAAADYFGNRDGGTGSQPAPDYFSETDSNASPDYFSDDAGSSTYDDTASDDTGGGGFDGGDDNSGSW